MKELMHSSASFERGSRVCWEFGNERLVFCWQLFCTGNCWL